MSRIPTVDPATATGEAKQLLDAVHNALGATPNMTRALAQSPSALSAYLGFSGTLAKGILSRKVAELVAVAVAEANGCNYCLSAHTFLGTKAGLTPIELEAGRRGRAGDPKVAATLRLAQAVNKQRGDVSEADLNEARRAGLGDAEIVETVAHVALNVFTNYFNRLARTEIDFPEVTAIAS